MKIVNIRTSGSGGSSSGGSCLHGQLLVTTGIAGAQAFNLPANIKVVSIVGKTPAAKNAVSMSVVGNADPYLFFGPVDFAAGESKNFSPNVELPAGTQILTANTDLVAPAVFKFIITYIILPASFI